MNTLIQLTRIAIQTAVVSTGKYGIFSLFFIHMFVYLVCLNSKMTLK